MPKKTVVMVHGAFGGSWTMENFTQFFRKRGWDCHAPNLRFHDQDPRVEPDPRLAQLSIEDYTHDLAGLVQQLDAPPILVGHSMGGVIVQKLAAQGLAGAVVLLNSSTIWGIVPSTSDERSIGTHLMAGGQFWDSIVRVEFELMSKLALNAMDPATQREVFDRLGPESGLAVFELFFWMFDDRRTTYIDPSKVNCPLLVVTGDQDRGVSRLTASQIADRYGEKASVCVARGHGHYLMLEDRWQDVAEQCQTWMSTRI